MSISQSLAVDGKWAANQARRTLSNTHMEFFDTVAMCLITEMSLLLCLQTAPRAHDAARGTRQNAVPSIHLPLLRALARPGQTTQEGAITLEAVLLRALYVFAVRCVDVGRERWRALVTQMARWWARQIARAGSSRRE